VILLAAVAGVGLTGGAWLVVVGLRPDDSSASPSRVSWQLLAERWRELDQRRITAVAVGALAAGVVVRWPIAIVGGAALGWMVPLPGQRAGRRLAEARTEGIAQWCEMLRDAAGTARGIEGILVATSAAAPAAVRPEIRRLARRLEDEPLEAALDGLADDLAHPIGDLVVTALRVAATAGSRRVATVLGNLASAAYHEATMRRRVEVARARPRATMRLVALIVGAFVAALVAFAREYLAPYSTVAGQLVLLLIGCYWAMGFWWMARLGRVPEVARSLTRLHPGGQGAAQ